nr:class I SAM-dependent methyltransferase [candidate division Zixibacteria bacterium]
MQVENYKRLSHFYDNGWGRYAIKYLELIDRLWPPAGLSGAHSLDLACGTGNLAIELARRGFRAVGLDLSPAMIAQARKKASGMDNISFAIQDMRRFKVAGQFDLVTCTFDSINYLLEEADLEAVFEKVHDHLKETGRFIFDSNTHKLYSQHNGEFVHEFNGERFLHKCRYEAVNRLARTSFEFGDGSVEEHIQCPYDIDDLEPLLNRAGLGIVRAMASFDMSPYQSDSKRLICLVERQKTKKKAGDFKNRPPYDGPD